MPQADSADTTAVSKRRPARSGLPPNLAPETEIAKRYRLRAPVLEAYTAARKHHNEVYAEYVRVGKSVWEQVQQTEEAMNDVAKALDDYDDEILALEPLNLSDLRIQGILAQNGKENMLPHRAQMLADSVMHLTRGAPEGSLTEILQLWSRHQYLGRKLAQLHPLIENSDDKEREKEDEEAYGDLLVEQVDIQWQICKLDATDLTDFRCQMEAFAEIHAVDGDAPSPELLASSRAVLPPLPRLHGENAVPEHSALPRTFAPSIKDICLELDQLQKLLDECSDFIGQDRPLKTPDPDYEEALAAYHVLEQSKDYTERRYRSLLILLSTLVPNTIQEVQLMQAVAAHLTAIELTSTIEDYESDAIDDLMVAIGDGLTRICGASPLTRHKAGRLTIPAVRSSISNRDRAKFAEAKTTLTRLGRDFFK